MALHFLRPGEHVPKHPELERFAIDWLSLSRGKVDQLEAIIDAPKDERPIQKHLQAHPELLGCLLRGGRGRYVRSQLRLGSQDVPDFLIAESSSVGLEWHCVELENPRKPMCRRDGRLAAKAQEGLAQIQSWRRSVSQDLDYAQRQQAKDGLAAVKSVEVV